MTMVYLVRCGTKIIKINPTPYTPIIPALRKLRQDDHKFKNSLEYTVRFYFRNKTRN